MPTELTHEVLQRFSPVDGLKRQNLAALTKKTAIQTAKAGRLLFKAGDSEKRTIYLISGSIELRTDGGDLSVIEAGTKEAHTAISPHLHHTPRGP